MLDQLEGPTKIAASVLLFPLLFQGAFLEFAWGAGDEVLMAFGKRVFLLLPALAVVFACWITIVCLITVIFRHHRRQFMMAVFVTWWDLGRVIFAYWGGIFKFVWMCVGWLVGFLRLLAFVVLLSIKDLFMSPIRLLGDLGHGYLRPGIPWPAVTMMIGWTLLEAVIFTYVMSPLVVDVLSGLAGTELEGAALTVPLFLMFVVFVMGSYAVLHSLGEAIKSRDIPKIVNNVIIEVIVAMVEVVFLYREFVDALVPWFAQHSGGNFELGIFGIIGIAAFAWLGIRAMTWFLFGASAVPTLMAIIQRTGFDEQKRTGILETIRSRNNDESRIMFVYIKDTLDRVKKDAEWIQATGEDFVSAFIVPPLQIVAACINFCALLIASSHLFELPFKSFRDILDARMLLLNAKKAVAEDA